MNENRVGLILDIDKRKCFLVYYQLLDSYSCVIEKKATHYISICGHVTNHKRNS